MQGLMVLQGQLFLLILLGVFFRRHIVDAQFQKGLASLVVDLILPCNIITSFQIEISGDLVQKAVGIMVISVTVQLGCWVLAVLLFRQYDSGKRAVLQYSTLCSNAGFLGTPIAEGLFGGEGVLLTAIYLIPQRIMMWTVGLSFFTRATKQPVSIKTLLNPCLVAVFLGLLQTTLQIPLPLVLHNTIASLGKCNTGLSLFMVGMLIADFHPCDLTDPLVLYYTVVRLFLIPLMVFAGGRLLQIDQIPLHISVILSAMPAGATSALLTEKYNGNSRFAASCVTVSTILSMVAIPLWCIVL